MHKFDLLEIQNFIEEKRLILGKKFEDFLLRQLAKIQNFCGEIFHLKNFAYFACAFIAGL